MGLVELLKVMEQKVLTVLSQEQDLQLSLAQVAVIVMGRTAVGLQTLVVRVQVLVWERPQVRQEMKVALAQPKVKAEQPQ
ncbi:MAG: hypothetical protein EBR82_73335 [Caulobacteraceae bacterium]|nr:hypothetical protein [Caulobacteraceae bacterium]